MYRLTTMELIFYTTYINVDLVCYERFHAKIGKVGIKKDMYYNKKRYNKLEHTHRIQNTEGKFVQNYIQCFHIFQKFIALF